MMQYKGYSGKVEYDDEAEIFHGEVIGEFCLDRVGSNVRTGIGECRFAVRIGDHHEGETSAPAGLALAGTLWLGGEDGAGHEADNEKCDQRAFGECLGAVLEHGLDPHG